MDFLKEMFPYFFIYFGLVNLILFFVMGIDKQRAKKKQWRISEATLFLLAFSFGAFGGLLGMYVFHHKTNHWTFRIFFPLLFLLQLTGVLWYIMFVIS